MYIMFVKFAFILNLLTLKLYGTSTTKVECSATTKYGNLQGKGFISRSGKEFCAYMGIPYASPPTGKLRFMLPTSPRSWDGIRDATKEENVCLQINKKTCYKGSEDCLYLNVFSSKGQSDQVYPVMVYIHGGGFHMGSSSLNILGPEYLLDKEIVLVTLQYRLGVFGFLSTEDEVVPGNMGLKDQVKALEWIQENIKYFGGDPEKVTIFGDSAGAASVHLHMQSPRSQHLFTRGISQSGTAISAFAVTAKGKARKDAEDLALSLNCTINSSIEIFNCLQNKSSIDIFLSFKKQLFTKYGAQKTFRPVVEVKSEHAFITNSPFKVTTTKPWLVGVNANEGIYKIHLEHINETAQLVHSDYTNYIPQLIVSNDLFSNLNEITKLIYTYYFNNDTVNGNRIIKPIVQLVTDALFVWPTEAALERHNGTKYFYLYNHLAEYTYSNIYGCPKGLGVSHTDELLVLFTQKGIFPELNEEDTNISKLLVGLWVNFATEGNPTPRPIKKNPQSLNSEDFYWERSNGNKHKFIHIQTNNLSMEQGLFSERIHFWKTLPISYNDI